MEVEVESEGEVVEEGREMTSKYCNNAAISAVVRAAELPIPVLTTIALPVTGSAYMYIG